MWGWLQAMQHLFRDIVPDRNKGKAVAVDLPTTVLVAME